jgi:hypothetical protein
MLSIFGDLVSVLSDQQAAQYAAFDGAPSRAELERYFFLDDSDLEEVQAKRRSHNRLGFAVQLTSVRYLGRFMPDPRQVPAEVAAYLAEQLGIADPSCLREYGERDGTARTHAGEIQGPEAGVTSPRCGTAERVARRASLDDRRRAEGGGEQPAVGHPVRPAEHRPAGSAGLAASRPASPRPPCTAT